MLAARAELDAQNVEESKDGQGLGSKLPELQERLEEWQEKADETAVEFRFRALGRSRLADLVRECPPTTDQIERWKLRTKESPLLAGGPPEFDYDTFAPLLIATAMVTPETTVDEVLELWNDPEGWSDAIWAELWDTAWRANQEVSTRPTFGTGSN